MFTAFGKHASTVLFILGAICFAPALQASDYSLDFVAAAPQTYNHSTGGGAFNTRVIGIDKDVVESLESGEFAKNDLVTFFVQIKNKTTSGGPKEAVVIDFDFGANSTGQPG